MSEIKIAIKHNKHRIHPCPNERKLKLLNLIISKNENTNILIISCEINEELQSLASQNVTIMSDKELYNSKDTSCDLLISYNLPSAAVVYMARLSRAKEGAIILLDATEQKELYPIETYIGKVIRIEEVEGFAHDDLKLTIAKEKPKAEYKFKEELEKEEEKEKAILKNKDRVKKPFDKKYEDKNSKFDKKEKNKWDAPKAKGKKISIKAIKPKKD